jgi:elongation factor P
MDPETFEQFEKEKDSLKDQISYLKEGDVVDSLWYEGELLSVQLPIKMTFAVTHTEPGLRGDRQTAGTKPASIETGTVVQVPLFIKVGDRIVIDTRSGKYLERAK